MIPQGLLKFSAIAGALVTLASAWSYFDLPMPAWYADIERLESAQIDVAIEVYQQKQLSLTLQKVEIERAKAESTRGYFYVQEELLATAKMLDYLRQKKIDFVAER